MEHKAFTISYDSIAKQPLTEIGILSDKKIIYKGKALWDTGATGSCIADNIAKKIGLPIISEGTNKGINNVAEKCNIYFAKILFPNQVIIGMNLVGIAERDDFSMLIGMDVIGEGEFAISNIDGKTKMSFCLPGRKHIDFVEEINSLSKPKRRSSCPCGTGKKYKNCCEKKSK